MKKKSLGIVLVALLLSSAVQAIDINTESTKSNTVKSPPIEKKLSIEKELTFFKSTETKEITFNLDSISKKMYLFFVLIIKSNASYGRISFEVIAPDNKVVDKFTLEGDNTQRGAIARLSKVYKLPKIGIWKVRIVTLNASANMSINTEALYVGI